MEIVLAITGVVIGLFANLYVLKTHVKSALRISTIGPVGVDLEQGV